MCSTERAACLQCAATINLAGRVENVAVERFAKNLRRLRRLQMVESIIGEQLQKSAGLLRSEARRHPVQVTYHGRPELVVMSIEDYELLRQNRKLAYRVDEMPAEKMERIAANQMDERHAHLNALMDPPHAARDGALMRLS
jgi:prevent-host-death family protein